MCLLNNGRPCEGCIVYHHVHCHLSFTLTCCLIQIMRLFSVAPFDQNLTLETGQCLHDDKATLADLHILPGSLIYLKVCVCVCVCVCACVRVQHTSMHSFNMINILVLFFHHYYVIRYYFILHLVITLSYCCQNKLHSLHTCIHSRGPVIILIVFRLCLSSIV